MFLREVVLKSSIFLRGRGREEGGGERGRERARECMTTIYMYMYLCILDAWWRP
jgi:hypothetical protein